MFSGDGTRAGGFESILPVGQSALREFSGSVIVFGRFISDCGAQSDGWKEEAGRKALKVRGKSFWTVGEWATDLRQDSQGYNWPRMKADTDELLNGYASRATA